ncbi:MAG TPA: glycine--tRNA ligase subunit beta [Gammaproteobacteria bacterium]|nr:glycine--tRNA ligase subunit beta [Gammaproteobacteria bacterium]
MTKSIDTQTLLVEIGCEELPPKALAHLAAAFEAELATGLQQAGLLPDATTHFFSPRRLAVKADALPVQQADVTQHRRGPAIKAAFDAEGKPTKAALGFAQSVGKKIDELGREKTDKGEWLACEVHIAGKATADLLPDIVNAALKKLPIPKRMRWGNHNVQFVRPVHWVVLLLGKTIIPADILGVTAGNKTFGHRFHAPGAITIKSAGDYPACLEKQGHVRVNDSGNTLGNDIAETARKQAATLDGVAVGVDGDLPAEVAALNEWPVPVIGRIPKHFLDLPEEVLITTLEVHQRYFPVRSKTGGNLLPYFITFANIDSKQPEVVQRGNERVVVPRLEDALFFWRADRKTPLAKRCEQLNGMVFQKKLGTLADKQQRVAKLASVIAETIGGDATHATRAAELAKCDLLSDMVGEFPELQGIIGRYYAKEDGEDANVSQAIEEQYQPRFAGDNLPASKVGQALAIADKLDTICGIFAIGQKPTGDKDPFALRRAALGLLRIIIEAALDLDLQALIATALKQLPVKVDAAADENIYTFFMERLRIYYLSRDISSDVFAAVLAVAPARPLDFQQRLQAVQVFGTLPDASALAAANKRIGNILRKAKTGIPAQVDKKVLQDKAEINLFNAIEAATRQVQPLLEKREYAAALKALATLRAPVDTFFDEVMVMADDPAIRDNRLALLQQLYDLFSAIADISRLPTDT